MKNNQSVINKSSAPQFLSMEDFMVKKFSSSELQFRFENKCFSITRAIQGKCNCCDAKVITFFGEEMA